MILIEGGKVDYDLIQLIMVSLLNIQVQLQWAPMVISILISSALSLFSNYNSNGLQW
jgi:hypothetical protein